VILGIAAFGVVLQLGLVWLQLALVRQQKRLRDQNLQLLEHTQRVLHGMRDQIGETIEDGDRIT
jgi:hypothetical protein